MFLFTTYFLSLFFTCHLLSQDWEDFQQWISTCFLVPVVHHYQWNTTKKMFIHTRRTQNGTTFPSWHFLTSSRSSKYEDLDLELKMWSWWKKTNSIHCEMSARWTSIHGFFEAPRGWFSPTYQDQYIATLPNETVENDTKIRVSGLTEEESFTQTVPAKEHGHNWPIDFWRELTNSFSEQ